MALACPFSEFGCEYEGDKGALSKHVKTDPMAHLKLLCEGVSDIKALASQLNTILDMKVKAIDLLHPTNDRHEKAYGVHLLWRIDDYPTQFEAAKSGSKTTIFSPPFLTSRCGYKLAVSAALYGDGKMRGKSMSVFACILKGDHDALLNWPWNHKINITLLDQNDDPAQRTNVTYQVKPNPIKENLAFLGRPTKDRNASFGAQKFCDLEMVKRFDYIKNDTMFIKVQVEMENMPNVYQMY